MEGRDQCHAWLPRSRPVEMDGNAVPPWGASTKTLKLGTEWKWARSLRQETGLFFFIWRGGFFSHLNLVSSASRHGWRPKIGLDECIKKPRMLPKGFRSYCGDRWIKNGGWRNWLDGVVCPFIQYPSGLKVGNAVKISLFLRLSFV